MNGGNYRSALFGPLNAKKSLPKFSIGDRTILEKRIHTNPKFSSISSRTNSGFNARRKEELQKEIQKYYKVSNNEVFSRISLSELMQLMIAYTQEWSQYTQQQEGGAQGDAVELPKVVSCSNEDEIDTVTQMESLKVKSVSHAEASCLNSQPPPSMSPHLLVDVRTPAEFQTSHLIGAVNHQLARLSRSVNWESKELLLYRNHPDRIIILYDYMEDLVPEYASILIHRGYENVYVLSGGLKLTKDKFGYPLVVDKACVETKSNEMVDQSPPSGQDSGSCFPNLTEKNLFKLANTALPLDVCEALTDQLSHVILPPLSTKGLNAEHWIQYGPDCGGSVVGKSVRSVSRERASGMGTSRSTMSRAAGSTVSGSSRGTKDGQKPWR